MIASLIKYSFENGFYYIWSVIMQKPYWLIGLIVFIALIIEDNRIADDEFIDEMRDLV